jgi:hypothetical protein
MTCPEKMQHNIFLNSYPVTGLKNQIITGAVIGFSVSFILIVFQPFGTYEFKMDYKLLFLFGYGIICALTYSIYYFLLMTLLLKWFTPQKWNILKEIITVFPVLIIMATISYYYYNFVMQSYNAKVGSFSYFLLLCVIVSIIPLSAAYYHKYVKSKLTTVKKTKELKRYIISIASNNKKEKPLIVRSEDLIYIKSDGNYIEVALKNMEKPYLIRNSLNYVENKLPKSEFLKIHRSYIVNIKTLDSLVLSGSSYSVKLIGTDILIPTSRSVVKTIRNIIG